MQPIDKAARIAGGVYLLLFTAPFSMMYVPARLIVHGNAAATAGNILTHETLFRVAIFADLATSVFFIFVVLALYHLLREVNRKWARLMVALVLVSAAVGFLNVLNNIAALTFFRGGDFLSVFDKPQRDALGMLCLRLHSQGNFMNELFWGLWLFPFGLLVFRSGFLPRILGLWLILNGVAYLALSVIALMFPYYQSVAFRLALPFLLGELAIVLWLLIKGAKVPVPQTDYRSARG